MYRLVLTLILISIGTVWGATIPLTQIAVSTGHHPFGLIFWQALISSIILYVITRWRRSTLVFDGKHLVFFLVIALTGTLVPNTTSYMAAFHLPGGVMALTIALVPMFSLLVALVVGLESFVVKRLLGIVLGGTAMALLVLPQSSLPDPAKAIFILLALVAPFCYGIEGNYLAVKKPEDTGPIAAIFGASVFTALIAFVLTQSTSTFINPLQSGIGKPELALFVSSCFHIIAYTSYIWMVGKAGVVFTAQVAYIVTPAGIILSMITLNEEPSIYIWLAMFLLLVGLFLIQPKKQES